MTKQKQKNIKSHKTLLAERIIELVKQDTRGITHVLADKISKHLKIQYMKDK